MSQERLTISGVTYTAADADYFAKRQLQRTAGVSGLWGLAVAAVISGDFSGWNFGLAAGGFGGLLLAFGLLTVMYYGLVFSIGEMAAAMPHTGGAYSFARAALGPWGGFATGLAETIEYVATTAVIVYFSAAYADGVAGELVGVRLPPWCWWTILYAVFIALNSAGAAVSFGFALVVSLLSLAVLALFAVLAVGSGLFAWSKLWEIAPQPGQTAFLPHGWLGVLHALPFGVWFFLGIEELPLAAEEARDPVRDIPRAGLWARATLILTGLLVLLLNTGVLGAAATSTAEEPLLDGFRAMAGEGWAALLGLFALIGLFASLQGIMFAYGRNMYSLSRAGYYPRVLSLTGRRKTPWVALATGGAIGLASLVAIEALGGARSVAGAIVLNIAVWGAMLAYLLQMAAYLVLRRKFPRARRPYRSPWGEAGAWSAGLIAAVALGGLLTNPTFLPAIYAVAALYAAMMLHFVLWGRFRLILSPEEEYAVTGGLHGNPQEEGYGGAVEAEILAHGGRRPDRD
jgi:ethanolamine permease